MYKIALIANGNSSIISCDGSYGFNERFIAFNVHQEYMSPSDYNSNLSALDGESGLIRTWNMGTGKVVHIEKLKSD